MHTHYYVNRDKIEEENHRDGIITDFYFMENDLLSDDISSYHFLHGMCDVFARYMAHTYGLRQEAILDDEGRLIHAYCMAQTPTGTTLFLDVRGWTDDYDEFLSEFDDWLVVPSNKAIYPTFGTVPYIPYFDDVDTDFEQQYSFAAQILDKDNRYIQSLSSVFGIKQTTN